MWLIEDEPPRAQALELHRRFYQMQEGPAMPGTFVRTKNVFRLKIAPHLKNARGCVVVGHYRYQWE